MENEYKNEIWKAIINYEGIYEVSNYGRVRRISYENTQYRRKKEIPYYIKSKNDKDGYVRFSLCTNNKIKQVFAHREVAKAFIPNPNNYPVINHKDCDKENNYVDNLEWCTIAYNNRYIKKMGRTNYCYGKKHPNSKAVLQYDKQGNFIRSYESTGEVERLLKIRSSQIRACCNPKKKVKSVHGFIFKYENQSNLND